MITGPLTVVRDTGPAASQKPEWWIYDDHDPDWKLLAICQGPNAGENARLFGEAPAMFDLLLRADNQGYFEKHEERERVRAIVERVLGRAPR